MLKSEEAKGDGVVVEWEGGKMTAAVVVGKWESRGVGGISRGVGNLRMIFHSASFPQPSSPGRCSAYNARAMIAARYFDLVREMKHNAYNHRLRLVESAKERGIKPTARLFATTAPTVRKWLRRFQQQGPSGLLPLARARHHQPHKTPPAREAQLVALRKTLPTFGARRLIREFDLPIGHGALERIWRAHGLIRKRCRKYQRKQDLAHIKARWALFQQISADTKDLDDIPRYWTQAQQLKLPVVQYTRRSHLPKRCRNRSSPRRRRVLRPGRFPKPRRFPRQGPHLSALFQSRAPQLPQRKPEPLANH